MTEKDGGPAFPMQDRDTYYGGSGMSLRDFFAAAALTGLHAGSEGPYFAADMAKQAYEQADHMLRERNK